MVWTQDQQWPRQMLSLPQGGGGRLAVNQEANEIASCGKKQFISP